MKRFCRILSISFPIVFGLSLVLGVVIAIGKIVTKPKDETNYAETITFNALAGNMDLYIYNDLIVSEQMMTITPKNHDYEPEFTIRKYGDNENEATSINAGNLSFEEEGEYVLACKIKANQYGYIEDTIIINVISELEQNTKMYLGDKKSVVLYEDGEYNIEDLVNIKYPIGTSIDIKCSEHFAVNGKLITALNEGVANMEVILTYDNISICRTFLFKVNAKILPETINLILNLNDTPLKENKLEINLASPNISVNYLLTNLPMNQQINCWTDSDKVMVLPSGEPTIVLRGLKVGEAVVYVSSVEYPQLIFEILVTIN
ncbi:MAG: hypothetical protein ACLRFE_01510 [Clostridia bacterium]